LSALVCLVLAADTLEADLRHVAAYRDMIDMVELRVDLLAADEMRAAARLPHLVDCPAILTVRRTRDGGRFRGEESDRVALLERLAGAGFAWVDLEEDLQAPALEEQVRSCGCRVIRSLHDFAGVPDDLAARVAGLPRSESEIPKMAVMPKGPADLLRILEACAALDAREKVILGMGDVGFPTRVLAGKLGSAWCYVSPGTDAVAPGQVDPPTLTGTYRFRSIGPDTAVFGVIGNPVMHSRSPLIHNEGYAALGLDAVYLPFLVNDLAEFWPVADHLRIGGLSVTVPHKQAVLERLTEADSLAAAVGACNTMTREGGSGPWRGANTDVAGFLGPLQELVGNGGLQNTGATVIGAGGAARGVVYALAREGARVLVLNRTPERARILAEELGAEHAGLDAAGYRKARGFSDLVVQTTSAGMAADPVDPAPGLKLGGKEIVYELVYSPAVTPFLERAASAGCRIVPGRKMLLAQAVAQFRLFTGRAYPAELAAKVEPRID
jgi:3-dehydroquinate dehydratase / shikimate dehydrogenase